MLMFMNLTLCAKHQQSTSSRCGALMAPEIKDKFAFTVQRVKSVMNNSFLRVLTRAVQISLWHLLWSLPHSQPPWPCSLFGIVCGKGPSERSMLTREVTRTCQNNIAGHGRRCKMALHSLISHFCPVKLHVAPAAHLWLAGKLMCSRASCPSNNTLNNSYCKRLTHTHIDTHAHINHFILSLWDLSYSP